MKFLSIFYHQKNIDGLHQEIHTREQSTPKIHAKEEFSSKGIIKLQIFLTVNMDKG